MTLKNKIKKKEKYLRVHLKTVLFSRRCSSFACEWIIFSPQLYYTLLYKTTTLSPSFICWEEMAVKCVYGWITGQWNKVQKKNAKWSLHFFQCTITAGNTHCQCFPGTKAEPIIHFDHDSSWWRSRSDSLNPFLCYNIASIAYILCTVAVHVVLQSINI